MTEVPGFCDAVVSLLNDRKSAMTAKGVDPTAMVTLIGTKRDTLNTANTQQENIKTQLREQTLVVNAANSDAYDCASNGCDQLIAAFGNNSEEAKEARALRKSFSHAHRTATPAPAPAPTP